MSQQEALKLPIQNSHFLAASGLEFDSQTKLWRVIDAPAFGYSDGNQVELGLLESLRQCTDVSLCSSELPRHIKDWATLYHFSNSRANVIRPIARELHEAKVLEIGAGCGAITRYLGETAKEVVAIEGSPRRALITRERTRDLDNVQVVAANMQDITLEEERFDVVTLIGVLEYARLFVDGPKPFQTLLEQARRHLKPDGLLVVAIENKLGLKYLSGAPEDHLGRPFIGVEDRYTDKTARTFGAVELRALLSRSGFGNTQLMGSFPDYKLPSCIISERGAKHIDFDPTPIIQRAAARDPQYPRPLSFDHVRAWRSVAANQLSIDLANSFIAIAHAGSQSIHVDLAYHFATDRSPAHRKQVRFIDEGDQITVENERIHQQPSPIYQIPSKTPYYRGSPLAEDFKDLLYQPQLRVQHLTRFFDRYTQIAAKIVGTDGLSPYETIDGKFLDLNCENIICDESNGFNTIDLEWISPTPIPFGRLIFRSTYWLLQNHSDLVNKALGSEQNSYDLAFSVFSGVFPGATKDDVAKYLEQEREFITQV